MAAVQQKAVVLFHQSADNVVRLFEDDAVCAEKAGLTAYASQLRINMKPLTREDYAVWGCWLPTAYVWRSPGKADKRRSFGAPESENFRDLRWEDYAHPEGVPHEVLIKIPEYQRMFDILEIRTPEYACEPILVGWIANIPYLLAQWAESAEHVVPFDILKRAYGSSSFPRSMRDAVNNLQTRSCYEAASNNVWRGGEFLGYS